MAGGSDLGLSQAEQDTEHLRLLTIFHYIVGGMQALLGCVPIIHFIMGVTLVFFPDKFGSGKDAPPVLVGWMFMVLGGVAIFFGWVLAICLVVAGRSLAQRKRYLF